MPAPKKRTTRKKTSTTKSSGKCNRSLIAAIIIAALLVSGALLFLAFQLGKSVSDEVLTQRINKGIESFIEEQNRLYEEEIAAQGPVFVEGDFALDRPSIGDPEAPVTIVGFFDYEDPFSKTFWVETLPLIQSYYIDEGIARFVQRFFPLKSSPDTYPAALFALCVRDQVGDDAFFTVQSRVFNDIEDGFEYEKMRSFAVASLEVDGEELLACYESEKFADAVFKDIETVTEAGFVGTPTFVINGLVLPGAEPLHVFEAFIEEALAGTKLF